MGIEISSGGVSKTYRYYPYDAFYVDANGNVNTSGNGQQVKEAYFNGTKYYPESIVPSDIIRPNGTTRKAVATGGISGVLMVDYSTGSVVHGYHDLTKYIPISEVLTPNWRTDPIARLENLPQIPISFSIQCAVLIQSSSMNIVHEETESSGAGYRFRYYATLKNSTSSSSYEYCISDAQCTPTGVPRIARVATSGNYWSASGVVKLSIGEVTLIDVFYGALLSEYSSVKNDYGWRHHRLYYPAIECVVDGRQPIIDENISVTGRNYYSSSMSISIKGSNGIDETSNTRLSCKLYTDATGEVFSPYPSPQPTAQYDVDYSAQLSVVYSDIQNIDNDSDYWPSLS